jgi:hypothetical protein
VESAVPVPAKPVPKPVEEEDGDLFFLRAMAEVRPMQALPLEPEPVGADVDDGSGEPGFDADIAAIFSEEATELTQAFICDVMLARRLLEKADQGRGRFRTLLLGAVRNYLADVHRRQTAQSRAPRTGLVAIDAGDEGSGALVGEASSGQESTSPERAFHARYVAGLIRSASERLQRELEADGDAASAEVPDREGRTACTAAARRTGRHVAVRCEGARRPWRALLRAALERQGRSPQGVLQGQELAAQAPFEPGGGL